MADRLPIYRLIEVDADGRMLKKMVIVDASSDDDAIEKASQLRRLSMGDRCELWADDRLLKIFYH